MKNPVVQTILAVIAGLVVASVMLGVLNTLWLPLRESPIEVVIAIVLGVLAFVAVWLLTSRSKEQIEDDLTNMEIAGLYKKVGDAVSEIRCDNRSLPHAKGAVILQTEGIAKSMELMTADLKQKPEMARLSELASYAVDFAAAFTAYTRVVLGQIAYSDQSERVKAIVGFETDLPEFAKGFAALSGAIDQDDALLAEVKRKLLKNKMANSGRIESI